MATIVFVVYPAKSHHNATYLLAKSLKAKGHKIIYAGNIEMQKEVRSNGCDYYVLQNGIFPPLSAYKFKNILLLTIFNYRALRRQLSDFKKRFSYGGHFEEIVRNINPDLFLIDSPFVRHSIEIFRYNIPFAIMESMMPLNRDDHTPPLNSKIVYGITKLKKLQIHLAWKLYFFKKRLIELIGLNLMPTKKQIINFCKKNNYPWENVDFNRYYHPGLNDIPELILSPIEFDFPKQKRENQHYLGPTVDLSRVDACCDFLYHCKIHPIIQKRINGLGKIVLCSLGSMSWRYKGIVPFFRRIVRVAAKMPDVNFVISIGPYLDYKLFEPTPPNVNIFQTVPQIALLSETDLMITHGGMNSISECIMKGVPMFILPGMAEIDQVGNAARVTYHKIGLSGSITGDSSIDIHRKIMDLLTNAEYKRNVDAMKSLISKNRNFDNITSTIESIVNR